MRLELSRRAQADLDDIRDYRVKHFGPAQAILYLDAIEQAFRRILAFPQIGASRTDLTVALNSLPTGEHRIFYIVFADRISIVRVLDKAMDSARYL